jgi:Bacteriophage lambda head decoration protein D
MATYTPVNRQPGDWLKWVEEGRYTVENGVVAAGSGLILSGTVMVMSAGKLTPMLTGGGANVVGILFDEALNSTIDQPVSYVTREGVVIDKGLTWAAGVLTADKTAAITKLQSLGIQVREMV